MTLPSRSDYVLERRVASRLLDVLIRAGLIVAMTMLCYRIFAPFLPLMVWAVILAVMIYPLHKKFARALGGRAGLSATLIVIGGLLLIVGPVAMLTSSLADGVRTLVTDMRGNALAIPPPSAGVESWPLVGERIFKMWSQAHTDLPALIASLNLDVRDLTRTALGFVANIGLSVLLFLASFIIAGIIMAFGEAGAHASVAIFNRIVGPERGTVVADLSTSTIRAVAVGVIGIALIQALLVGGALLIAGVPGAGVLAAIVMVLGIAQVPAGIVVIPAVIYLWVGGDYSMGESIGYSVLLLVCGLADNVLKPLLLGRGVDAPMPVILIGALGGFATGGILGLFLGATLLALGYRLFMNWVHHDPEVVYTDAVSASAVNVDVTAGAPLTSGAAKSGTPPRA